MREDITNIESKMMIEEQIKFLEEYSEFLILLREYFVKRYSYDSNMVIEIGSLTDRLLMLIIFEKDFVKREANNGD